MSAIWKVLAVQEFFDRFPISISVPFEVVRMRSPRMESPGVVDGSVRWKNIHPRVLDKSHAVDNTRCIGDPQQLRPNIANYGIQDNFISFYQY